ncbi:zf-HC2 domain-containing protein [Paenibacillus sp. E222]|uniref:anti-sigma factor family protein n=1 Tax=Paenibacillus sp. E222 TaxID=2748863 RepID=UPI0015C62B0A|nr:zf-HC2 domain-containing protein [Paenibacillus sp. E222]QLG39235.1 zf-HC2 domain-containing protein [Paenibacillus sp. E222]
MKCEEVVEWMHRYLDHDLGEAETAQMLQHVAQCAECAENFSLLRALSRELEDLPQVTPRFSLVDAIMPQLDAIDEAKREQSSTIQEMSPVPAAFENLQRSSERKPKQKWLNSMAGRMSMGAAAAAVVLGVAIFGYQPEKVENAEMIMSTGSTQEGGNEDQNPLSREINNEDSSSSLQSDNSVWVDNSESQPSAQDEPTQEVGPEENGSEKVQEPELKEGQTPKQPDTGSEMNKSDATKNAPSSSNPADSTKSADQQKSQDSETATGPSTTGPSAGSTESGATDSENQESQLFTSQDMPDVKVEEPTEGVTSPDSETGMNASGGNKGLAATDSGNLANTTPKEWKSPDGSYLVMLLGDQISIYSKPAADPDVLNLVEQRNVEGTLKSASWSQDSTVFNYETDQDGITVKKSFNVSTAPSGNSTK